MATLAQDPGRKHACRLIPQFMLMDARMAGRKIGRKLGVIQLLDALPRDYALPDSPAITKALEWVRGISPAFLTNHCLRSYAFGALLAARCGTTFDREVAALACIMHDVGLSEDYQDKPGSFEYVGAAAAHDFCTQEGFEDARAARVHDAIALHAAIGIAHKHSPEAALMHYGAGADVIGLRVFEMEPRDIQAILDAYPRLGFGEKFPELMLYQARTKPQSHIAGHMALGFAKKVRAVRF